MSSVQSRGHTRATPRRNARGGSSFCCSSRAHPTRTFFPLPRAGSTPLRAPGGTGCYRSYSSPQRMSFAVVLLLPVWPLSIAGELAFGRWASVQHKSHFALPLFARQIVRNIAHKAAGVSTIDEAVNGMELEGRDLAAAKPISPLYTLQNDFLGAKRSIPILPLCPVYFHRHYAWCRSLCLSWNARHLPPILRQDNGYTTALLVAGPLNALCLRCRPSSEESGGSSGR